MHRSPVVRTGTVTPADQLTEKHVAFEVPVGTTSIRVRYSYTGQEAGNGIDLGLLGVDKEFRGYSGGSKFDITVANDHASPGYIPGLLAPGEWYVVLAVYNVATPTAEYEIEVDLGSEPRPVFKPVPAPARTTFAGGIKLAPGQRRASRWVKGDVHMHTLYSDGKFTLDELVDKAVRRGLDFIFSTEHNTFSANLVWGNYVPKGIFVGRGIEVTSRQGHWNALGLLPDQYINPLVDDLNDKDASLVPAVEEVHKSDGYAIINHPFAECKCCDWSFSFHENMDGIEVWNGPWKRHPKDESNVKAVEQWDALLREGKIFTASGGSDIHEHKFEIAEPTTRVLVDDVSVNGVIRGMRARRVYVTQHPSYEIDFHLCHRNVKAGTGDWLGDVAGEVTAEVDLDGFPEGFEMRLITEKGIVHTTSETRSRVQLTGQYVRVEVRDGADNMLGLTNPIWLFGTPQADT